MPEGRADGEYRTGHSDTLASQQENTSENRMMRASQWLRRLGWVGILFFTAKGIVWLLIFWGAGSIFGC